MHHPMPPAELVKHLFGHRWVSWRCIFGDVEHQSVLRVEKGLIGFFAGSLQELLALLKIGEG